MSAVALVAVAGFTASVALARDATPAASIVGSAAAGKPLFVSTCGVCHTLKAAGTVGEIGPNLGALSLAEPTIIAAITNGGATVMTTAARAKYTTQMVPYKGVFTSSQIDDIAAFVFSSMHPATSVAAPGPTISVFAPAGGKVGSTITISGANLTGATSVKIGARDAAFKVVSATKLTATVPSKATTGRISVATPAGTAASSKSFTVT